MSDLIRWQKRPVLRKIVPMLEEILTLDKRIKINIDDYIEPSRKNVKKPYLEVLGIDGRTKVIIIKGTDYNSSQHYYIPYNLKEVGITIIEYIKENFSENKK